MLTTLLSLALTLSAPQTYDVANSAPPGADLIGPGRCIDVDGTRALVGSFDGAWVVERRPTGRWEFVEVLESGLPDDAGFGYDVAVQGSRAVVGAPFDSVTASRSGSIFVFERDAAGAWNIVAKLFLPNGQFDDFFGWSVALDGDRIAVGAPFAASPFGTGVETGAVHVYDRLPNGAWVLDATLGASTAVAGDRFGDAVDVDGDRVLAGAPSVLSAERIGRAWVFDRDPAGFWIESAELMPTDEPNAALGDAVALDGDRLAVSAYKYGAQVTAGGAVWIYELDGLGTWTEVQELTAPGATFGASFGSDLELRGDRLLGGAYGDELPGEVNTGSVHLFQRGAGGQWDWVDELVHADVASGDFSGRSVGLGDGWILTGSINSDFVQVLYAYAASADPAPKVYGVGTPGCSGPLTLGSNLPPLVASDEFTLETHGLPPLVSGLCLLGPVPDGVGSDPLGLGVVLHVDPFASPLLLLPSDSDAAGLGSTKIPIPPDQALVGAALCVQTVWFVPPCPATPLGLSSSNGLLFELGAP